MGIVYFFLGITLTMSVAIILVMTGTVESHPEGTLISGTIAFLASLVASALAWSDSRINQR